VSAFTKASFGELAPFLAEAGYQPVPIKPGFKAPLLTGGRPGIRPNPTCLSTALGAQAF
jgi:hypothetical protein